MQNYPEMFEIDPRLKVTIITNSFNDKDENVRALKGRTLYYRFEFTYDEVMKLMEDIAKQDYSGLPLEKREEVQRFIQANTNPATDNLNLRLLIKGFEFRKNAENWQELLKSQIEQDEYKLLVWQLETKAKYAALTRNEKISMFCSTTGYSKRTYENLKKSLGLARKWKQ